MRVFIVLAIRGYEPLHHALQIWKAYVWFFEHFYCYLSLVFYILGAFLIKQLFHLCLLDMRWLKPTQRYVPCWLSIISYPTRSRGIIDNYSLPNEWMMRDPNNVPPLFLKQKSWEHKKILYQKIQKKVFKVLNFQFSFQVKMKTLIEQWNCFANRLFT